MPVPFVRNWQNQHLLKDCGLVPYMLHKVYGYSTTMLSERVGEYPYLERYVHGLQMAFLPACADENELYQRQQNYILENHAKIDLLILIGPYFLNQELLFVYRELRPEGKVYLALDANSFWMDRLEYTDPKFEAFLDACDVIGTSCHKMQRHLNRKWPRWKIEYLPNGFFNVTGQEINVSPVDKENIILTVGRIGDFAKANHILLEAFAHVEAELQNWQVHLIGGVEESFKPYIVDYFRKYPQLLNRVIFKGRIDSKEQLYAEYKKAKIFVLTSLTEGGFPNVIGEALYHGCYVITSGIDAAEEITNYGALGQTFPLRDVGALAEILRQACSNEELIRAKLPDILAYARNTLDWELVIKRLHHLLFEV